MFQMPLQELVYLGVMVIGVGTGVSAFESFIGTAADETDETDETKGIAKGWEKTSLTPAWKETCPDAFTAGTPNPV
jgi:hypothetical protein